MTPENKVKRKEIIRKIWQAEMKEDFSEIETLGMQLMFLEEPDLEKNVWNEMTLTPEEYREYCNKGFSDSEIALICEVSLPAIYKFRKKYGIKAQRKLNDTDKAEICKLVDEGVRKDEIAKKFNIHRTYIYKVLERNAS